MPTSSENGEAPVVFILVLSYNGLNDCKDCFASLSRLTYPKTRLILIDNASTDGTQEYVLSHYPHVTLIQNERNLGFGEAMNIGIRRAIREGARYVALLNQDTEVEPRWISEMVRVAESDPAIGAVASRMMHFQNRRIINGIGGIMNYTAIGWDRFNGRVFRSTEHKEGEEILYACGGACLLRVAALRCVGLFDPRYGFYYEDADLNLRLHEAGYLVVAAPSAVVYHKFSAASVEGSIRKNCLALRARLRFVTKFFPFFILLELVLPAILREEWERNRDWFKKKEYKRNLFHLHTGLAACAMLPELLAYRFRTRKDFWGVFHRLAIPGSTRPVISRFRWDYQRATGKESNLTNRIRMGVSDTLLGDGWYPREGESPCFRWTCDHATCFLKADPGRPSFLRLRVSNSYPHQYFPRVRISMDGFELGEREVAGGEWSALHFEVTPKQPVARLDIRVPNFLKGNHVGIERDFGVRVGEVSLIPQDTDLPRETPS